jgi:ribosomal protein L7/L12
MKLTLTKTEAEKYILERFAGISEVELQMDVPPTNVAQSVQPINISQERWNIILIEFFNMADTFRMALLYHGNMKIAFIKAIRGYFWSHGLTFGLKAAKNLLEANASVNIRDMGHGARSVSELTKIYENLG